MPKIKSVKYVGKKEQKCLYLSSPDHLYITDDRINTHNSIVIGSISELALN